jgi:hypothetical protein
VRSWGSLPYENISILSRMSELFQLTSSLDAGTALKLKEALGCSSSLEHATALRGHAPLVRPLLPLRSVDYLSQASLFFLNIAASKVRLWPACLATTRITRISAAKIRPPALRRSETSARLVLLAGWGKREG